MPAPRPTDPRPADPRTPGPRRKARAGFLIAALVAVIAAVTFVGMNIEHARELEESPPASVADHGSRHRSGDRAAAQPAAAEPGLTARAAAVLGGSRGSLRSGISCTR